MLVVQNTYFQIFGLTIRYFGAFLALGLLASFLSFFYSSSKRLGLSGEVTVELASIATIAGVIGAHCAYLIEGYGWQAMSLCGFLFTRVDGLSVLGALVTVPLTLFIWARFQRVSFFALMDALCIAAPLFDFFGRLGCLFGGCCYGLPSKWCSVMYLDARVPAPAFIHLFPVQLVAALLFLTLFFVLFLIRRYLDKKGENIPGLFLALYFFSAAFIRFCLDFLRGDRADAALEVGQSFITNYQFGCLAVCLVAVVTLGGILWKKYSKVEAS